MQESGSMQPPVRLDVQHLSDRLTDPPPRTAAFQVALHIVTRLHYRGGGAGPFIVWAEPNKPSLIQFDNPIWHIAWA